MPRLNLEDSIYSDVRFQDLMLKLGNVNTAYGAIVRAWRLAQSFYLNEETNRRIPVSEWEKQRMLPEIIEVGLAQLENGLVYVAGSDDHFSWLLKAQSDGKKSGEVRRKVPSPTLKVTTPYPEGNRTSSSSSSSSSSSKEERIKKEEASLLAEFSTKADLSEILTKRKISQGVQKAWLSLYTVDYIDREAKRADLWGIENPGKGDDPGFISRWLARSWDEFKTKQEAEGKKRPSSVVKNDWSEPYDDQRSPERLAEILSQLGAKNSVTEAIGRRGAE